MTPEAQARPKPPPPQQQQPQQQPQQQQQQSTRTTKKQALPQMLCYCVTAAAGTVPVSVYALLDVAETVKPLEMRRAYRQQALRCHADKLATILTS